MVHQLDLAPDLGQIEVGRPVPRLVVEPLEEVGHRLGLVELSQPLVHPGEALLIRAHDHREPHVPDLVVGDLVHAEGVPLPSDTGHHGVFHPTARRRAIHRRHMGIGIGQQILGEELDRVPAVAGALVPVVDPLLGPPERLDQRRVRLAVVVRVAHGRIGGVPQVARRGRPRHVPDILGPEPPGDLPVTAGGRGTPRLAIDVGHHVHDAGRGPGGVEPRARLRAERLVGVLQGPRGRHQPAGRQRQAHVVVAVAHVELGGAEVLVDLPPVDVVIDGHLRVPVVDEEDLAVLAPARCAVRRDTKLPGEGEVRAPARQQRLGQPHAA